MIAHEPLLVAHGLLLRAHGLLLQHTRAVNLSVICMYPIVQVSGDVKRYKTDDEDNYSQVCLTNIYFCVHFSLTAYGCTYMYIVHVYIVYLWSMYM